MSAMQCRHNGQPSVCLAIDRTVQP